MTSEANFFAGKNYSSQDAFIPMTLTMCNNVHVHVHALGTCTIDVLRL